MTAPTSRRRAGFTLIELLVVMAILATLLSIALPRYFASVDHSREVSLRQNLKTMRSAIDQFHADTGRYPADLDELVARHYLAAIPPDPISDSTTTWQTESPPDGRSSGVHGIRSGAPGSARDGSRYQEW